MKIGVLALIGAVLPPVVLDAQSAASVTLTVEDSRSAALPGATVSDPAGQLLGRTDRTGHLTISCAAPCRVRVAAEGFAPKSLLAAGDTTLQLEPAGNTEEVTVTAYRTPLGVLESPVTSRILSEAALSSTPAITLDEKLRQLPGVELYRRSSSLVANPSSQGLSLRGLGSTSASRTLITEDDVPLNDPFAGWIHWQEQPELSIQKHRTGARRRQRSLRIERHRRRRQSDSRAAHLQLCRIEEQLRRRRHLRQQPAGSRPSTARGACWPRAALSAPTATFRKLPGSAARSILPATSIARTACFSPSTTTDHCGSLCAAAASTTRAATALPTRPTAPACGATQPAPTGRARMAARWLRGSTARPSTSARSSPASPICPTAADPTCSYRCGETSNALLAHARQRTRRGSPLEPAARRGPACSSPEPTSTMCACGTANRPIGSDGRADQPARPPARLRRAMARPCGSAEAGR